jgi:hypothetical protein
MLPKHLDIWLPAYIKDRLKHFGEMHKPQRLWVTIADHYEPCGGNVSQDVALNRVRAWQDRWPQIATAAPRDADGRHPCYTVFYPQEEYNRDVLSKISELVHAGYMDAEVHIHHDHDTPQGFKEKIEAFCHRLHEHHGLLRYHDGRLVFGFIHGNWALDNSRPDGRWCGVQGELQLLRELGCYADFTMPSVPSSTQGRIVNQIYWTAGDPSKPRGFDQGIPAKIHGGRHDGLLMITGPLGFRYRDRAMPRIETGELAVYDPATAYRVKRWIDLAPRIGGDIFLKLYAHGAREDNATSLLGEGNNPGSLAPMFRWIHEAALERGLELHWACAFQMFRAIEKLTENEAAG